jgi:uncharacterized protein YigA (DUF484 family)
MSEYGLSKEQREQENLVAEWLLATPGFFDRHSNLLAQIQLKSPHGDKAISLQEKQMTVLRSQNKDLNQRLAEMLTFGAQNDKTQNLMVVWLAELLATNDYAKAVEIVTEGLNKIFELGQAIFIKANDLPVGLLATLAAAPYCGSAKGAPQVLLEVANINEGSLAALALSSEDRDLGLLVLVSPRDERFTTEMGLVYLKQLSYLAAAALGRFEG